LVPESSALGLSKCRTGGSGLSGAVGWGVTRARNDQEPGTESYNLQLNSGFVIVNSPIHPMN